MTVPACLTELAQGLPGEPRREYCPIKAARVVTNARRRVARAKAHHPRTWLAWNELPDGARAALKAELEPHLPLRLRRGSRGGQRRGALYFARLLRWLDARGGP